MTRRFWRWLALFAFRRWSAGQPPGRKPVGVPGNRDPDHRCDSYAPRKLLPGEWADCQSDGHYLCRECCHLDRDREDNPGRDWIVVSTIEGR
jgi:hypothetical protein